MDAHDRHNGQRDKRMNEWTDGRTICPSVRLSMYTEKTCNSVVAQEAIKTYIQYMYTCTHAAESNQWQMLLIA